MKFARHRKCNVRTHPSFFSSIVTDVANADTQRNANVAVICPAMTSARPVLCSRALSAGCQLPQLYVRTYSCFVLSQLLPHRVTRAAGIWRRKGQRQTIYERYLTTTHQLLLRLTFQRNRNEVRSQIACSIAMSCTCSWKPDVMCIYLVNRLDTTQLYCTNLHRGVYVAVYSRLPIL